MPSATSSYAQAVQTRIGKIEVESGYPSKASLDKQAAFDGTWKLNEIELVK